MAIEVDVRSRSQLAQKDLDNLEKKIVNVGQSTQKLSQEDFKALSKSVGSIDSSIKGLGDRFSKLAVGIGSFVAASAGLSSLAKATDSFTRMSNKIRVTTDSVNEYNRAILDTRRIAIETGQNLEDITTLYSKLNFATKSFGASQKDVARVTGTVSKALAAGGASIQERQAAILQLGQAMSSAFVQGDELRTLREAAPFLIKTVADNLGVTVGEIKKLGEQGALSSEVFFNALLEGSDATADTFEKMSSTYERAFTTFGIGLELFVKQFVSAFGAGTFADTLNEFAKRFARAAMNFDSTLLRMRASFWIFVADLSAGFPKAVDVVKSSVKNIAGIVAGVSFPTIDLNSWIPKLDPIKKTVMSFIHTIEYGFWWLYDKVVGNSWWPDLILEIGDWARKLVDKPLAYVTSFVNKVNEMFKNMSGPKMQVSTVGMASAITVATVLGLTTAFATGSIFKTLAAGIGTAVIMGFSKEANAVASIFGAVLTSGIALFAGNPLIKVLSAAMATIFTVAAVESKADVSKSLGESVLQGLRWAFDRISDLLYGSSVFGDKPFMTTLFLLAKIALLFSAGRAAFLDAAKSLATAGNSVGKNISDVFEKGLRTKTLDAWTSKLDNLQNSMKTNADIAKRALNVERSRLATLKSASGKVLGRAGLNAFDTVSKSGDARAMSAFTNSLSAEAKQSVQNLQNYNKQLTKTLAENKRLEETQVKTYKEAIKNQKSSVDQLSNSLREASLRAQNAVGNIAGGAAGIFGSFAGYNVGRKIADGMTDSPAWAKLATPLAAAFVGQMLASGIGQIVGRFTYLLVSAVGGSIAKAFWTYITVPLVQTFYRFALAPLASGLAKGIAFVLGGALAPIFLIPGIVIGAVAILVTFKTELLGALEAGALWMKSALEEAWTSIKKWLIQKFPETAQAASDFVSGGQRATSQIQEGARWLGGIILDGFEKGFTLLSGTAVAADAPNWNDQQRLIANMIREEASKQGLGQYSELLVSLAERESSLNPNAKNPNPGSTASGVFQFISSTAKGMGLFDVFDASKNIEAGVRHFGDNLKRFGDPKIALAAHHVGPGKAVQALTPGSGIGDVDVTTQSWLDSILNKTAQRTGNTFESVSGMSMETVKNKLESLTPAFVKDIVKAFETGGVGGAWNELTTKFKTLFEFEEPKGLEEAKTSFLKMLEAAKTGDETLALVNKRLAEIGAPALPSLDALEEGFESFFDNLVKLEEVIAKIADPQIAYFARKNLEKLQKEFEENIRKTANALQEANERLKENSWTPSEANQEAGNEAAKSFTSSFVQGFSATLKGEMRIKDLGKALLDTFTSSMVDAFSKSFIENLMDASGIQEKLGDLFARVFMIGEKGGRGLGSLLKKDEQVINANTAVINTNGFMSAAGVAGVDPISSGFKLFDSVKEMFGPKKVAENAVGQFSKGASDLVGGKSTAPGFGKGIFDLTLSKIGEVDTAGSTAFAKVAETATGSFEGLGGTIGSIFQGLGSSIGNIFQSVMGMFSGGGGGGGFGSLLSTGLGLVTKFFGFAEGGPVRGAGTGTSDSIYAALSHGEFVVRASQATKFLPLLTAINAGTFPRFASGGLVSSSTPANIATLSPAQQGVSSQQVFNISITGDISRQTKREIYTMLPEIANGVNSHNREIGYRG